MKRILNNKMPVFIICWAVIIGMVLTSSPAFSRERNSSRDRDRTHESGRSYNRDSSHERNRSHNRSESHRRTTSRSTRVVHVHRSNALPAIIATGIVAGITFSLLDRNDAPAPRATAPSVCPTAANRMGAAGSVMVTAELLNIRSGPGLNKPPVGQIRRGTTLSIMGNSTGWYYVMTSGGVSGWVMAQYTTPVAAVNG